MNKLRSLKEFTPEMNAKINSELMPCAYGRCGNGAYFWDFEEMKFYSPYDDELISDDEQNILVGSNGKLYMWPFGEDLEDEIQEAYKAYTTRVAEHFLLKG